MLIFWAVVFFISLLGIAGLFGLKYWESAHGRVLYPNARTMSDEQAVRLKALVHIGRTELSKLPPQALIIAKRAVHRAALGTARLACEMERRSHQLADMVSHKHRFEKREPRSEFLKQVGEHPISNNNGSNGNGGNGAASGNNGARQL